MEPTWPSMVVASFIFMVIGFLLRTSFKSSKESVADVERRTTLLETMLNSLALRFEGSHNKHDEALNNLTKAVERLTQKFERYVEIGNGK